MNWQQAALTVLVGSLIGYVTNWIAIRMLFRPRHEIRIMGMHLPFTPGVIPRGKKRLAESVGEVVGGMLLTDENVLRHMLQPGVEEQVRHRVNNRLAELTARGATVGDLLGVSSADSETGADTGDGGYVETGIVPGLTPGLVREELAGLLAGTAAGLLQNNDLRRPLALFAASAIYDTLDRPVGSVAGSPEFAALKDSLEQLPGKILARDEVSLELRARLAKKIENLLNSPEPVGSYLPGAARDGLHQLIADQTPRIAAALEQYLSSPGVRQAIKNRIEDFFEGTALKRMLNGMFQLAGTGPDAIVRRLARELASFLSDEQNRAELEERLHILVDEALEKSVAETTAVLDAAARREKAAEIADWLLDKLHRPETLAPLLDALEGMLATNSHRTWRELFYLDELGLPGMLEDYLDRLLVRLAEREQEEHHLERLAGQAVDGLLSASLSRVLELLPPQLAANPGEPVLQLYRYAVRQHIPGLLSFFDITGMVRQRVEELDVLQVEEMLLGIVRRELVAITWLGALLGAVLGAGMVGMQYMMR
ncbi:MAG: DUF445 family protein [Desulfotomaculaceae bacterium]